MCKRQGVFAQERQALTVSLTRSPGIARQPKGVCRPLYPKHAATIGHTTWSAVCDRTYQVISCKLVSLHLTTAPCGKSLALLLLLVLSPWDSIIFGAPPLGSRGSQDASVEWICCQSIHYSTFCTFPVQLATISFVLLLQRQSTVQICQLWTTLYLVA